jgi:hypothetical protein
VRDKGRREVSVLLKRDSVLSRVEFCGLYWLGSLKEVLKVEEIRVASSSAHSSSSGSQRGLPLNGERSRRVAGMVVAIAVWCVRGCEARLRAEEKGELRESVQLLGSLSESSCGFGINSGAISDPCVVCAPPRSTSDDGDGAGRIGI